MGSARDFDDWKIARQGKRDGKIRVPIPLGLVETMAAKHHARYGKYPADYAKLVELYCGGTVPRRVTELADELRRTRPWDVAEDAHPGMTRIHFGPHSFLCPTTELLGSADAKR